MLQDLLIEWGVPPQFSFTINIAIKFVVLIILCVIVNYIAKKFILRFIRAFVGKTKNKWDDVLVQHNVFKNLSHFAPAFLIYFLAPTWFSASQAVNNSIHRIANTYMIIVACWVITAILNAMVIIYQRYEVSRQRPIKGYIQAVKIIVYFMTGLFVVATLLDKSPWGFLSVFGGLTAVSMLIFKDMILGLVAGIQLTSNNMVARGDWIEMPNYGADGDVIDITLTTVMVRNWDKTITTIPTYALITDSFKNWKGMNESGGRRIKRSIHIDMNSIKFADEELIKKLEKLHYLNDYLMNKRQEISEFNKKNKIDNDDLLNGRHLTNIGTFRAYLVNYLRHHPKIHKNMTFLVRHLPPTEHGLPIEIYVFSNDQVWANYEAIQADIFDHVLAIIPEFDLQVFQRPTGADFLRLKV